MLLSPTTGRMRPALCSHGKLPNLSRRMSPVHASRNRGDAVQHRAKELIKQGQDRWNKVENKRFVVGTSVALVALVSLSNAVLDSVEQVPVFRDLLVLLGLVYSSVFVWRYVLFAEGRRKLEGQVTALQQKATEIAEGRHKSVPPVPPSPSIPSPPPSQGQFVPQAPRGEAPRPGSPEPPAQFVPPIPPTPASQPSTVPGEGDSNGPSGQPQDVSRVSKKAEEESVERILHNSSKDGVK